MTPPSWLRHQAPLIVAGSAAGAALDRGLARAPGRDQPGPGPRTTARSE